MVEIVRETRVVHGYRRAFLRAGSGPALLLVHGIGNNAQTWASAIGPLSANHTVIAPDLLGHGASDKPRGDYSIAGYANGMRDLLSVLDIEQVTVVGHSLGGGVALQFAYQFPERCQRIVLVGSGGLGPELSAGLRAATLPGAELVLTGLAGASGVLRAGFKAVEGVGRVAGWKQARDLAEAGEALLALRDVEARRAFLRTLRSVVDARGQAVTAVDRLYLANAIPMLVIWGSRDPIVPISHADTVRALVPTARVEVFEGAGHWPHIDDPDRFCRVVTDFLRTTEPAAHDRESWRALLAQDRSTRSAHSSPFRPDGDECADLAGST
jgi:pimeloyl-ACP methyl ester carboxylesterase